ncbi:patatin-like phospholipase family protein [Breoghania sp. L-A4]|uniref:patatin-like phospholipase family protein n=1 Tax=Breoghania sp. L-A4 TaxID=2304600 RepID=UPI00320492F6
MLEGLSRWLFMKPVQPVSLGIPLAAASVAAGAAMTPPLGDTVQEATDSSEPAFRPRVGLALGSGAARGWAHIGVIKALEEAGIRPDIVTGTSIGAVVGGCYLAGKLDMLETFALGLTRRRMLGLMDFTLGGSGLISGNRLMRLLKKDLGDIAIEDLDGAFTSVATELGTGHEIWLRSGSLVEAMSASYALPGIFQPAQIGGRWLVDGALVNPIPVSVCRALGARVVIAVNPNADVFGHGSSVVHLMPPGPANSLPDVDTSSMVMQAAWSGRSILRDIFGKSASLPGIAGVMMEAFSVIQDRIGRSRLAGDPPDVIIGPSWDTWACSISIARRKPLMSATSMAAVCSARSPTTSPPSPDGRQQASAPHAMAI